MRKIRLLYITQSYGGVEIYLRQIIERLDYSRFDLYILAPTNTPFEDFCKSHDVTFFSMDMSRGIDIIGDTRAYIKVRKYLKSIRPDIVHTHSSKAGIIGRIAASKQQIRHVFTPHGISYLSFSGFKRSLFILIESFVKRYTDKVLACSYSEGIRFEFEIGIPKENITCLPNAINTHNVQINNNLFNNHSAIINIGSIARLTHQKNPLLFVEIAKQLSNKYSNVRFSILGTGLTDHLKEETIALIQKYDLQNKFEILGWGDRAKSIQYLKSLDIFILPSIFEGLPLSLLEAMSCGTISITSKCDGCNDVIQHGENGFACITAEQYVDIVTRLIENENLQKQIRESAVEYIKEHHNIDNFIKNLEAYYLTIYNEKS